MECTTREVRRIRDSVRIASIPHHMSFYESVSLSFFFLFLPSSKREGETAHISSYQKTYPTLQGVGTSDDTHYGIQTKSLRGGEAKNSTTKTVTGGRSLVSGVPMVDMEQQLVLGGRKLSLWELISGLAAAWTLRKES
eukprot:scaffold1106_cov126-Cylindrotheca_fusiformis.AAC.11